MEKSNKREKLYKPDTLVFLDPFKINFTPWNPKGRKDATKKDLIELMISVAETDQWMAALIDEYGDLIDGNRRVLVAREIKRQYHKTKLVKCQVADTSKFSAAQIYAQINAYRKNIGGSDTVELYLNNKEALPEKQKQEMVLMERALGGESKLRSLVEKGLTKAYYGMAKRVINYVKPVQVIDLYTMCNWMLNYSISYTMRRAMKLGIDPELVVTRLNKNYAISEIDLKSL